MTRKSLFSLRKPSAGIFDYPIVCSLTVHSDKAPVSPVLRPAPFFQSAERKARQFGEPLICRNCIPIGNARLLFRLFQCRGDKLPEERMRTVRAALELGMELNADEERMIAQLHRLHDSIVR